ncbi:hypothetical protein A1O7_06757 [Cladophialophora yegresii CBS 114405]|uniref:Uncharacterized protein n=1 Tax=Cladophialophora yegresii CBS 114405 TaxID=1182544 RepID=W9WD13_9EURO|nr:uncharacterized protein A1O7_06757 [Cladophialophora yegresii CBS 114405]EXJ56414.1 hypothetical protein A1O7_06757 [Cladophialophora yegresii CBS 114405]
MRRATNCPPPLCDGNSARSSPLSSPPLTQSATREASASQEGKQFRPTRELPFEVAQHVQTYLEEGLFTQAFDTLLSVTGNNAFSVSASAPVTIPPVSHLALAATLTVHPSTTTRTNDREKWNQANAALRLLKLIHSLVGPVNANFAAAFTFHKFDLRFSRRTDNRASDDDEEGESEDAFRDDNLNTTYARSHSLWTRAEDFWRLVGWAFNCACLPGMYGSRWTHYRLLLEFLVSMIETDWRIRTIGENPSPDESLLWQYIELASSGHARQRRIIRAIFADGSARSLAEFREIFAHELKEPKQEDGTAKKLEKQEHVNIDQDFYGDYLGQEDDDVSDGAANDGDAISVGGGRRSKRLRTGTRPRTPSAKRLTPRSSNGSLRSSYTDAEGDTSTPSAPTLGDSSSISLRLRLLRLLTWVSAHDTLTSTSPTTFPDLEELFILFVEFIRPLSLPVFAQIVLPSPSNPFDATTLTSLCESILQRMLEHSAPSRRSMVLLSQSKLEEEYLRFAASKNSADANARVSILLESLARTLAGVGALKKTPLLLAVVAEGVERRVNNVAVRVGKKGVKTEKGKRQSEEALAWEWLVESGERISKIVDGLDGQADTRRVKGAVSKTAEALDEHEHTIHVSR